jgi:hypothetical protein
MSLITGTTSFDLSPLIIRHKFNPPEIPDPFVWTSSALKLFRRCKRKFFWRYIMRLRPNAVAHPLIIGSHFHEAIATWYVGKRTSMDRIADKHHKLLTAEIRANLQAYNQEDVDKATKEMAAFGGMMRAYADFYAEDREKWIIDESRVEVKFKLKFQDFEYHGKIDAIPTIKKRKREVILVEHKTASRIGESYIDRLPLDTQIRSYFTGARDGLGLKPSYVLYDVVGKSSLRRKSNEKPADFNERVADDYLSRPERYLYREELAFSNHDVEAFKFELHQAHREFLLICSGEFGDPRDPRSWMPNDGECNAYFKTCDYMKCCNTGLNSATSLAFRQIDTMHEELAEGE